MRRKSSRPGKRSRNRCDRSGGDERTQAGGALHALLRARSMYAQTKFARLLTSFAFFFFLLSSYFVLRPIRDAVAAASGVRNLPWLFAGTLAVTLIFNPLFSGLVVRFPIRRVIPISYHFFVANLARVLRGAALSWRAWKVLDGGRLDRSHVFRLDDRVRAVQYVDLLVAHGRCVSQRPGEADVRFHRRWRDAWVNRRIRGDGHTGAENRRREPAARLGGCAASWRSSPSSGFRCGYAGRSADGTAAETRRAMKSRAM